MTVSVSAGQCVCVTVCVCVRHLKEVYKRMEFLQDAGGEIGYRGVP